MAWPPKIPAAGANNATVMLDVHPEMHNDTAAAVEALIGRVWTGTQAEYDAIGVKNDDVVYVVI